MNIRMSRDCDEVNWALLSSILARVGMASLEPEVHERLFRNSQVVAFAFDSDALVGFGRALSDRVKDAGIFDVAVAPEYQGRGIGTAILDRLMNNLAGCNVILFANPGREDFYARFGFKMVKTAMARFTDEERMRKKGIID